MPCVLRFSGGDIKTVDQHKMTTQTQAFAQAKICVKSYLRKINFLFIVTVHFSLLFCPLIHPTIRSFDVWRIKIFSKKQHFFLSSLYHRLKCFDSFANKIILELPYPLVRNHILKVSLYFTRFVLSFVKVCFCFSSISK